MLYLININFIAFVLMYTDKRRAIKKGRRIPEITLLFIAFIGGCYGMLLGMYLFNHKTRKLKFKLVSLFSIIYIVLFIKYKCL